MEGAVNQTDEQFALLEAYQRCTEVLGLKKI